MKPSEQIWKSYFTFPFWDLLSFSYEEIIFSKKFTENIFTALVISYVAHAVSKLHGTMER